jgi:hypothetical protein
VARKIDPIVDLWTDNTKDSEEAEELLVNASIPHRVWPVDQFHPQDEIAPPPLLITPQGCFAGVKAISAYSRLPLRFRQVQSVG